MYTIGEFASIGRVSVRMLRHYDAIGLLRPAEVDPRTGYRRYEPAQLTLLHQVVSLRELGFSLDDIARAVAAPDDAALWAQLFRRRRAALEHQLGLHAHQLGRVEARLRILEGAPSMPETTPTGAAVDLKPLPPVRLAELSVDIAELDPSLIGPAVGPLFDRVAGALASAGAHPIGPPVAYYESPDLDSGPIRAHVGFPVLPAVGPSDAWQVVELEPTARAASLQHRGPMSDISASWAALRDWITARPDLRPVGVPREVYLDAMPPDDQSAWVTELQWPVESV